MVKGREVFWTAHLEILGDSGQVGKSRRKYLEHDKKLLSGTTNLWIRQKCSTNQLEKKAKEGDIHQPFMLWRGCRVMRR